MPVIGPGACFLKDPVNTGPDNLPGLSRNGAPDLLDLNNFGWSSYRGGRGINSKRTPFGCELRRNEFKQVQDTTKELLKSPRNFRMQT